MERTIIIVNKIETEIKIPSLRDPDILMLMLAENKNNIYRNCSCTYNCAAGCCLPKRITGASGQEKNHFQT
jgi:hypothetical protein